MRKPSVSRTTIASLAAYALLLLLALAEQWGKVTSDTKAALVSDPGALLRSTFSLWNPHESLGDLQNQAYGYLFPMGSFYAALHAIGIPLWIVERLWSVALVVVAWEGARLLCRRLGLGPWAAWGAGMAYALDPRMLSEIGTRSAEVNPTAVLPWVLLPVVLVLQGRLRPWSGALLSGAAFLFSGGVNGTATIAPLPLVAVFVLWGIRRRLVGWSFLGWWVAAIAAVSAWWASSLVQLSGYSPPFFDYVEDAPTTTRTSDFDAALRGVSNWVGYLTTGDRPSWPAAWSLTYDGTLVIATGVIAAAGLIGLTVFRSSWRTPLAIGALVGLVCLTIGHTSYAWVQSPIGLHVQRSLDHPFALLRNIAKIDPVLRLPLAVGVGAALARLGELRRGWHRPRLSALAAVLVALALVVSAEPVYALHLRTPGWKQIPSYWTQTADYLARQPGQNAAWVVPGSGFGIETWGWTLDEPMSIVGKSPWTTRSQVPLTPPASIRMLSGLEDLIDSGAGSPNLGAMLARIGLGYVVVRHDLDPTTPDEVATSLVSIALARSGGLERVALFGKAALGPQVEVFKVVGTRPHGDFTISPTSEAVTVSAGPSDVLGAIGAGALDPGQEAVVRGDSGWRRPAQVVGDGYELRERQFGLVHDAEGAVLSRREPAHATREVQNYPGAAGSVPVHARYTGISFVDASTSQGFPTTYGPIRPEDAPYAAVDGDDRTAWTTGYLTDPVGQWLDIHLRRTRREGVVTIQSPALAGGYGVTSWTVTAGGRSQVARVDPQTGLAAIDLGGVRTRTVRLTVRTVHEGHRDAQISISEVAMNGLPATRTLVVPRVPTAPKVDYLFHARAETRACVPTLLGPDCEPTRYRPSEEGLGIDRTITVGRGGSWSLAGTVVAQTTGDPDQLLTPFGGPVIMHGSSTYYDDPTVSARMAYDGATTTSWIASAADAHPTLSVGFDHVRSLDRITISPPASPGVAPTRATLIAGAQRRVVDLGGLGLFKPLRAKNLRIVFSNPTRGRAPIGVAEVRLGPGVSSVPLDGATATGAVCGFGPNVYVDGHRYLTKVTGLMGDVVSDGPLSLSLCHHEHLAMSAGVHRVRIVSTAEFQPTQVVLEQPDATVPSSGSSNRTLRVVSNRSNSQRLEVGPGAASLLATDHNTNAGWRATLDGTVLRPQQVDGWAQGWRVPAGAGGTIQVTYTPQRPYLVGLVGGLVLAGLVLLLAVAIVLVPALRRRVRTVPSLPLPLPLPQPQPRPVPARRATRARAVAGAVAVVVAAWVLGGLPGLLGALLALVLLRARSQMPTLVLGGVLLLAGPVWTAWGLHEHGPRLTPVLSDVLSGTGAVLLLVTMLLTAAGVRPAEPLDEEPAGG